MNSNDVSARSHAEIWDSWNAGDGPRYPSEKVVQYTFRNFPAETRSTTSALDLGCGSGVNTWFLAREGFRVTATDFSPRGLGNTRRRLTADGLDARLVCADASRQPFCDASFDYLICVRVLELLPSLARQQQVVAECSRLLSSGGRGLALFASQLDYGYVFPEQAVGPFYPPSEDAVREMFAGLFTRVDIDTYQTSYESGKMLEHNFLVTFMK